ncbi:MAG: hypothetical protein ACTSO9_03475 [Candidatus Helarchaeota archaeon]
MKEEETDYVIRYMSIGHCARGPLQCEKCKEAEKNKKYYLLRIVYGESEHARPVIEITKNGKRQWVYYDTIKGFEKKDSAIEYAKENNLNLL